MDASHEDDDDDDGDGDVLSGRATKLTPLRLLRPLPLTGQR